MCFIFIKVLLQGKVSYFSMSVDVSEGSKNLKSERITCTYENRGIIFIYQTAFSFL
jgi:hypothetical protein